MHVYKKLYVCDNVIHIDNVEASRCCYFIIHNLMKLPSNSRFHFFSLRISLMEVRWRKKNYNNLSDPLKHVQYYFICCSLNIYKKNMNCLNKAVSKVNVQREKNVIKKRIFFANKNLYLLIHNGHQSWQLL